MTTSSPANHENPPQSPLSKGGSYLPFVKGGGRDLRKVIFNVILKGELGEEEMRKVVLLAIAFGLLASGCVTNRNLRDNDAVRELRVVACLDGWRRQKEARLLVNQTNLILERQMGARLNVIEWRTAKFPPLTAGELLHELERRLEKSKDFDIGILFTTYRFDEWILHNFPGLYEGVTDPFYNRYVIVYVMNPLVLAHEIHHCVLGDNVSAINVKLVPFLPSIGNAGFLFPSQIAKAKANKWRNFSESPIELSVDNAPKQDWVQIHFPHWKEKYPDQFGPGSEYAKTHGLNDMVQANPGRHENP